MAKGKTEGLTYDEVEASFRKKNFSPLYLFHGEEDFLVEEAVGQQANFWRLGQALSALYPVGSDEKRWVDGVLTRKRGLGFG